METKQQRETLATFEAALGRRGQTPKTGPAKQARQIIGRKKDTSAWLLEISRIRPDEGQVRRKGKSADDEETQRLAESIREYGLLQAIDVRWIEKEDIYEIISGERRFTAATKILKWDAISVRILDAPEDQIIWLQLHENVHRKNLHPLDLAHAVNQAMKNGMNLEQIAIKLCKSQTYVQKALTVSKQLTPQAEEMLRSTDRGSSLDTAYEVATLPTEVQAPISKQVAEENLNQKQLRSITTKAKQKLKKNKALKNGKTGRPSTAQPFSQSIQTEIGITITAKSRKSRVTNDQLITALQQAIKQVQNSSKKRAA